MLHSICQQIWNSALATGWEKVSIHSNPKEGQWQKYSNYHTIALISHASKVILIILQPRLQQYVTQELPDVQARLRKCRGTRDQIASICWIMEKAREFQTNIYSCFTDYAKALHCMDHKKLWKILPEMGMPDHLNCFLRNSYTSQEATVKPDMEQQTHSKIGKEYIQAVYCHTAYLTYMQSTSWEMSG